MYHVQDLNLQMITSRSLSFSSPFSLWALDFPTSAAAKKAAGPYFSTKPNQNRVYARAFILWFDTFFSPQGGMAAGEQPVKMHSEDVDVGHKTTSEKRRGGLRSSSIAGEKKDAESQGSEIEPPLIMTEEPVEEREESFSTGPFSKETHWKQVVFLLKEPIELDRGAWLTSVLCPIYVACLGPGPRAAPAAPLRSTDDVSPARCHRYGYVPLQEE